MRDRQLALIAVACALGLVSFSVSSMTAQTPAATQKTAKPPVTPWGTPDLQGTWFVTEDVPMERSAANADREFLTDEEVEEANRRKAEAQGRNTRAGEATRADVEGAYNAVFNSILRTGKRTSRIIDPPDGRIPPAVGGGGRGGGRAGAGGARGGRGAPGAGAPGAAPGAGAARGGAPGAGGRAAGGGAARGGAARGGGRGVGGGANDNPEQLAQNPRCLGVGLPFLPINTTFAQGTVMRIVQSPKSVTIYMEDDHAGGGNRVIYMDGQHPPASMKLYLGDSRGRWEGNTLVVETTNLQQGLGVGFGGARSNPDTTKLIERYTRVGPFDLRREVTFDDPQTWTRPFTVLVEMGKVSDDQHMIFESACHEGNYGMTGILAGSRAEEKAQAAGGQQP